MNEPSRVILTTPEYERLQELDAFIARIQYDSDRRRLLALLAGGWKISGITVTDGNMLEHFAAIPRELVKR